jgi:hypothetical protein
MIGGVGSRKRVNGFTGLRVLENGVDPDFAAAFEILTHQYHVAVQALAYCGESARWQAHCLRQGRPTAHQRDHAIGNHTQFLVGAELGVHHLRQRCTHPCRLAIV